MEPVNPSARAAMTSRAFFLRVMGVCLIAWTGLLLVLAAPALREMLGGGGSMFFALHVNDREVPVTGFTVALFMTLYLLVPPALLAFIAVMVRALIAKLGNRQNVSGIRS